MGIYKSLLEKKLGEIYIRKHATFHLCYVSGQTILFAKIQTDALPFFLSCIRNENKLYLRYKFLVVLENDLQFAIRAYKYE